MAPGTESMGTECPEVPNYFKCPELS